ncbi:MAG: CDP-diacylglycerol--serine O-phosphatidyltransferase, partial [Chthoniobacteraceae bacterium]|nr:CDP-diacylglycerol--serine O-phosphatidyltransferase [Chthoniobacteraceae bacterium]
RGTIAQELGEPDLFFFKQTYFHSAIWLILIACIFDMLDGRLARLGGHESDFGREFDSLADVISFGVAPAMMLYKIVLQSFAYGWAVSFLYLLCGALRLARFNCLAAKSGGCDKDFRGFPIPAAAGVIASVTLFILWWEQKDRPLDSWRYLLLALMIFLSFMMFSGFKYPSFKALNWRTKGSIPVFVFIFLVLIFTAINYMWMPAVLFISYLLYGFLRPFLSKRMRQELEEEPDEKDDYGEPKPPKTES